jgi:hypothetical protein
MKLKHESTPEYTFAQIESRLKELVPIKSSQQEFKDIIYECGWTPTKFKKEWYRIYRPQGEI